MPKFEHIFWGIVLLAAVYIITGPNPLSLARGAAPLDTNQQAAPAGGHTMPDGTWMAGSMGGGGGCGMAAGGGGCGCGGGR